MSEEECKQLMEMLEIPSEEIRGVVNLRIALFLNVPEKYKEENFKQTIEEMGAKITLNHNRLTLRKWVFHLETPEVKKYLEEAGCLSSGSLNDMGKRFSKYVTSTPEEECKHFFIQARDYIEL